MIDSSKDFLDFLEGLRPMFSDDATLPLPDEAGVLVDEFDKQCRRKAVQLRRDPQAISEAERNLMRQCLANGILDKLALVMNGEKSLISELRSQLESILNV